MVASVYGVGRFRRAIWQFIGGRLAQAAGRAALVLVLVRLLPVEEYGAYMLLVGLAEMTLQVASFGILPVAQRYLPEMIVTLSIGRLYRFVSALVFLQVGLLAFVSAALWNTWGVITPMMGLSGTLAADSRPAVLLFLLIPALRFVSQMQEALLEQGKSQLAQSLMPIGRIAAIGVLLWFGMSIDLPRVVAVDIAVTGVCLVLAYGLLRHSLRSLHNSGGDGGIPVRAMVKFASHMAFVDLNGSTSSPGAVRLAVANALGVYESGLFAFLQSLRRLIERYMPGTLMGGIIRPVLVTKMASAGGLAVVGTVTGLVMKANLVAVVTGSIVIAVGGDQLIMWLSGQKFPHAGFTALLMFIALFVTAQRSIVEMVMQVTGHSSTLRNTSWLAPASLLTVWIFAGYGLNVAILILTAGVGLSNAIAMATLNRFTGFRLDWRGVLATLVPGALSVGGGFLLARSMNVFAATAVALVLFVGLLLLSKPLSPQELQLVERAIGRRFASILRFLSVKGGTQPAAHVGEGKIGE